jgi:hypothetical protein
MYAPAPETYFTLSKVAELADHPLLASEAQALKRRIEADMADTDARTDAAILEAEEYAAGRKAMRRWWNPF